MDPEQALREIISEASATNEPIPPMLRAAIERGQKAIDDYYDDLAKHAGETHDVCPHCGTNVCAKVENGVLICSFTGKPIMPITDDMQRDALDMAIEALEEADQQAAERQNPEWLDEFPDRR